MDEKHLLETAGIDAGDWEKTPVSVRQLVVQLGSKIEQLERQLKELQQSNQQLREKVNRNSQNSHSPPASDEPQFKSPKEKKRKGKKRGGQPGHQGHSRFLYPVSECQQVRDYYPQTCAGCGEKLRGFDPNPYRHQVVEIPPIQLQVEEHRLHQLECHHCGHQTRATLPQEVEVSGYGERVVAIVSLMNGMYRHSHRMVVSAMCDFFGVKMSVGSVNRLRSEASEALLGAVEEAKAYIQSAPRVLTKVPDRRENFLALFAEAIATLHNRLWPRPAVPTTKKLGPRFLGKISTFVNTLLLDTPRANASNF